MQKSICRKAAWGILERLLREVTLELSLAEWIPYHQVDTIYVHILHWGEHTTDRRNSLCRGRRNHKINNSLGNSRQLSYWKDRAPSKECLEKRRRKICLGHWFSSFRVFRITQRGFENKFLDSSSRVLGWGLGEAGQFACPASSKVILMCWSGDHTLKTLGLVTWLLLELFQWNYF